jgi:hypothetical protein
MRKAVVAVLVSLVLALVSAVPATAATQQRPRPGAPGIGDPYFPSDGNGGYQVDHYGLDVSYDPATDALRGVATLRATSLKALSRFNLDLVGLTVDSVKVNGKRATWSRSGQELRVTPRKAIRKKRDFEVVVRYHGVPKLLDEPALGQSGVFTTDDGAIIVGQPHVAATWFPVNDHPLDKASYRIKLTVPRGVEAISNGELTGVRHRAQTSTWTWVERAPMASYLATAAIGQFNVKTYTKDGLSFLDAIDPKLYDKPEPRTGEQFALSSGDNSAYKRLARTISVPAGGGKLSFSVVRNTEAEWDFFAVEAHAVGSDSWTTLADANGHTSTDTGAACPYWLGIHPFLSHYQTANGPDDPCTPTGSTGGWNAASGASDGYENWSVDLSAYAGQQVEVSLSVISDDTYALSGAYVDDIVGPAGQGTTSFEDDGNTLDGWTVAGEPAGSPANPRDWQVADEDPSPTVGDNAEAALNREPAALRFLSSVLGPYPFKQAGGIVDDDPGLGFALETQTRPVYSKAFFDQPGEANDSVIVHELAHQWTGDDLALARWKDIWLNEGFASYMEWLWADKQDRYTPDDVFNAYRELPADDDFWKLTIGDPGFDHLFDGPVYDRGALTLHALRMTIGDEDFFRLLKQWTAKYSGGNVTTAQFIALAEKVSGQQLDSFFTTWLYTGTKPAALAPAPADQSTAGRRQSSQQAAAKRTSSQQAAHDLVQRALTKHVPR